MLRFADSGMGIVMLKKLPDGQMVDRALVESVEKSYGIMGEGFGVSIILKGGKQVSITCKSEAEMLEMLENVAQSLDID